MQFGGLEDFLTRGRAVLARGPVALIFAEDEVELTSTVAHHLAVGFRSVAVLKPGAVNWTPGAEIAARVAMVTFDPFPRDAVPEALTRIMAVTPEATWLYWGYNAEYLFFPFCETRTVGEMLAFHAEERRKAMIAYVIDLYAPDLQAHPDGVSREAAHFDRSGYYAAARYRDGQPLERQMEVFGGIRWRFEEHIPWKSRRLDRVALIRPEKGLQMRPDFTLTDEERNTISCPWHHNLTAAVASFRTAKALRANPGSKWAIGNFLWRGSERFDWSSKQLLDAGMMEPGQWF